MPKFIEYTQNNSGGSFTTNDKLCHRVFIEVPEDQEKVSDDKALELGIYFDGCRDAIDCSCCGDRWYHAYKFVTFPFKFSEEDTFISIEQYAQYLADNYGWTTPDIRIYYLDGRVQEIFKTERSYQ